MIQFVRGNMAPLMFGGMILFMLIGYPAAFSLAATGLFFGFIGIELGLISPDFLGNLTYQLFGIVSNDLLLAIPFFTFMGAILERCGLAEDLLDSIGQLFGPVRGGLSYAVIFVGAILGAITGTVAASVIAMGVISMTPMLKYGYSTRHTMGVIAASGTITQLIPPSLVLVVLADQLGNPLQHHQREAERQDELNRPADEAAGVGRFLAEPPRFDEPGPGEINEDHADRQEKQHAANDVDPDARALRYHPVDQVDADVLVHFERVGAAEQDHAGEHVPLHLEPAVRAFAEQITAHGVAGADHAGQQHQPVRHHAEFFVEPIDPIAEFQKKAQISIPMEWQATLLIAINHRRRAGFPDCGA